jgi:hypothetical protein
MVSDVMRIRNALDSIMAQSDRQILFASIRTVSSSHVADPQGLPQ